MKKIKLLLVITILFLFNSNVYASNIINSKMTQEEINEVIKNNDEVIIEEGNYSTKLKNKDYHKIINLDKKMTVNLCGEYTGGLQIIAHTDSKIKTICDTTLIGTVDKGSASAAIVVDEGTLSIDGVINIKNYNNGVRIGYTNLIDKESTLELLEKTKLTISDSSYANTGNYFDDGYDEINTKYATPSSKSQGCGTSGSGIYVLGKGYANIIINKNAILNNINNQNSGIYVINVKNFTLDMKEKSKAYLNNNSIGLNMNTDYAETVNVNLNKAQLDVSNNKSNGIVGNKNEYVIDLKDSKMLVNKNGSIGINNMYIKTTNSTIQASDNNSHGITNVSLDSYNSTIKILNNRYIGLNITRVNKNEDKVNIVDSTLNISYNGGSGLVLPYYETLINNTEINTFDNGKLVGDLYGYKGHENDTLRYSGIVSKGTVSVIDSSINNNSAAGISLYNTKLGKSIFYVLDNAVIVLNGNKKLSNMDIIDSYNTDTGSGRIIVNGGSLQLDMEKTSISNELKNLYKNNLNPVISLNVSEEIIYSSPINKYNTALTMFTLHKDKNKELVNDYNSFTYIDPNSNEQVNYKFRYNKDSEDLTETGNKAYIWTPVSIVNYDATEGEILFDNSTSGEVLIGNSITNKNNNINNLRYTQDITVYGNSLNIAEKIMPKAINSNYIFEGWYIPSDVKKASEYTKNEQFDELYKLLTIKFDETNKIEINNKPVEELTVYAKWKKTANLIIKYQDEDGNTLANTKVEEYDIGVEYKTIPIEIKGYILKEVKGNETGTIKEKSTEVIYIYKKEKTQTASNIPYTGTVENNNKSSYIKTACISLFLLLSLVIFKKKLL